MTEVVLRHVCHASLAAILALWVPRDGRPGSGRSTVSHPVFKNFLVGKKGKRKFEPGKKVFIRLWVVCAPVKCSW